MPAVSEFGGRIVVVVVVVVVVVIARSLSLSLGGGTTGHVGADESDSSMDNQILQARSTVYYKSK
jgi:hypothetical protein